MKTTKYLAPAITIIKVQPHLMKQASITDIGGNAGLGWGNGATPKNADSRRGWAWDDEDEDDF